MTEETELQPMLRGGSPSCNNVISWPSSPGVADVSSHLELSPQPPAQVPANDDLPIVALLTCHPEQLQNISIIAVATLLNHIGEELPGKLLGDTVASGQLVSTTSTTTSTTTRFCFTLVFPGPGKYRVGINLERIRTGQDDDSWLNVKSEEITVTSFKQDPNQDSEGMNSEGMNSEGTNLVPLHCREADDIEYTYTELSPWKTSISPPPKVVLGDITYHKHTVYIQEAEILGVETNLYDEPELSTGGFSDCGEGLFTKDGKWYEIDEDEERSQVMREEDEVLDGDDGRKYRKGIGCLRGNYVGLRREVVTIDTVRHIAHLVLIDCGGQWNGKPWSQNSLSPDGTRLAEASDNTLKIWDTDLNVVLLTLDGHIDAVFSSAFSPNGMKIASIVVELHGTYFQRREVRAVATLVGPNAEGKLFGNTTVIGVSVSPILINFCFDLTISEPGRFFVGIRLEEGPFRVSCGHVDSENIIVTAFDQHADPDSSHIPELSRSPFDQHADPDSSHIPELSHSPSEVALLKPDPGLPKRKSHEDMCGGTSKKVRFDELTIQVRRKSELAVSFSSAEAPTSTFKEVDGDRRIEDGMAGETTRSRFRSDAREQDKISVEQGDGSAKVMKKRINKVKEEIQEKRMLERRIGSQTDREERRLSPQEVINKSLSISTRARNPTDSFDKESSDMRKSWAVDGELPTKDSNDQPPNQVSTGEDDIPRFTDSLVLLRCREEDDNEYTYDGYFPWKVRKSPVKVAGGYYVKNELLIPEAKILSLDLYCPPESTEVDGILVWGEGLYSDKEGNWYWMCQDEERLSDVDEEDEIWEQDKIWEQIIWKYSKTTGLFPGLWVRLTREVVVADGVRYIAHFVLTESDETDRTTGASSDC